MTCQSSMHLIPMMHLSLLPHQYEGDVIHAYWLNSTYRCCKLWRFYVKLNPYQTPDLYIQLVHSFPSPLKRITGQQSFNFLVFSWALSLRAACFLSGPLTGIHLNVCWLSHFKYMLLSWLHITYVPDRMQRQEPGKHIPTIKSTIVLVLPHYY